jgi:hypothetical protein
MAGYDIAANPLNRYENLFALTEVVHIASLALSVGMIALVDFSLLGLGWRGESAAKLEQSTGMWTLAGLTAMVTSGLALFSTDPPRYFYSPTFRVKMALLVAAILWNYTAHRLAMRGQSTQLTAGAGAISLALWASTIFGGLFFAFTPGGY